MVTSIGVDYTVCIAQAPYGRDASATVSEPSLFRQMGHTNNSCQFLLRLPCLRHRKLYTIQVACYCSKLLPRQMPAGAEAAAGFCATQETRDDTSYAAPTPRLYKKILYEKLFPMLTLGIISVSCRRLCLYHGSSDGRGEHHLSPLINSSKRCHNGI